MSLAEGAIQLKRASKGSLRCWMYLARRKNAKITKESVRSTHTSICERELGILVDRLLVIINALPDTIRSNLIEEEPALEIEPVRFGVASMLSCQNLSLLAGQRRDERGGNFFGQQILQSLQVVLSIL